MTNNKEIPRTTQELFELHAGDSFTAYNDELTMATTQTINFAFKTPALTTSEIHMVVEYETLIGGYLEILEAATWTAKSGTIYVPINRDRNSSNQSLITGNETTTLFTANEIAFDVTSVLTTNATTIWLDRAPAVQKKAATSPRELSEFILKAATTYVIRFTAVGNSNSGFIRLSWYEHLKNIF